MTCHEFLEPLNALLDGELPAAETAALTLHLSGCPACAQTLAELAELRAGLAQILPAEDAPPELQARIEALLGAPGENIIPFKKRNFLPNRPGWLAAGAIAAALMLALLPRHDETKDLMSVHDAALRGPVLATTATASVPQVPGFQLTGSRMDEIAGHVAQVGYYTQGGKTIALCIWRANGEPAHGVKHGEYHGMAISYWNDGKNEYWAASLTPGADLQKFTAALAVNG